MFKRNKWITILIIYGIISLMSQSVAESIYRSRLTGMDLGMGNQGFISGGPMNLPVNSLINNINNMGMVPSPGMEIIPLNVMPMPPPSNIGLVNDPILVINQMNLLNQAVEATAPLIMSMPPASVPLIASNPTIGNPGLSPALNIRMSPLVNIGMMPFIDLGITGFLIGMPGLLMNMPGSVINYREPIFNMPGAMLGISNPLVYMTAPIGGMINPMKNMLSPMMNIPVPIIGMPGPMMNMPGQMIGMPGHIMNMPGPMMGRPGPMIGMPGPMIGMPGHIMNMPGTIMGMPAINTVLNSFFQPSLPNLTTPSPIASASGLLIPPAPAGPGGSCTACHSDLIKMTGLGYPQFYFDLAKVQAETGMPALCDDCHLGNPLDFTLDGAHTGLLGLLVMKEGYRDIIKRKDVLGVEYEKVQSIQYIRASNTNDPRYRLRVQSPFHMLLWHDRNLGTASWNPDISMNTCGRCHPVEVAEFSTTEMGLVQTMSQYIPWIVPPIPGQPGTHLSVAPQSCGLWTSATVPPNNATFTDENRQIYNSTSTSILNQFLDPLYPDTSADPLTMLQALANQRNCNKCHPSCLDCHYVPFEENIPAAMGPGVKPAGTHTVTKRPLVMNCMGIGRGQFCHGGAIERRRGDGFVKGAFAHIPPPNLRTAETLTYLDTPDIHYNGDLNPPNASCVDCHSRLPGAGGPPPVHGDMNRNPEPDRCAVCHPLQVASYLTGTHRNLTCGACHTPKIVGYAFNFWAPGSRFGITPNPLDRHARYAVNAMAPVLLTDESGKWAPYHVMPHISTHIDPLYLVVENLPSLRVLLWRNQPDIGIIRQHISKDGVAITGSYNGAPYGRDEGQVMVWLNIDKIAHSITSKLSALPPRTCIDCHSAAGTQRIAVSFGWNADPALVYQGLNMGTYDIIVDGLGIRIENLLSDPLSAALEPMIGKWSVFGSYIIPPPLGAAVGHPSGVI